MEWIIETAIYMVVSLCIGYYIIGPIILFVYVNAVA